MAKTSISSRRRLPDLLKQHFTEAPEIASAMAALLGNIDGKALLEPSVGTGSLLDRLDGRARHIDAIDIDPTVLAMAGQRCPHQPITTHCLDFIDLFAGGPFARPDGLYAEKYDGVIANPPFGIYLSPAYRKQLKKAFPDLYVRESYGLFFVFSLLLLRAGGRFVFLLPDSFLASRNHAPLRRFIASQTILTDVIRFPSRRFESVNFGYGHLCIIAGQRGKADRTTMVRWTDAFDDSLPIMGQPPSSTSRLTTDDLLAHADSGWRRVMGFCPMRYAGWAELGSIADCRTGLYTGDNGRFVGYDPARVARRLNGHAVIWSDQVHQQCLSDAEKREGLAEQAYVPLVRGGHRRFNDRTPWAVRWDADALRFYRSDKKARLQNLGYYFRSGLAVPMVTSRRLSASLMDGAVFDQGVVGVFPNDPAMRDALLLYFNSSTASELRNQIVNGSANNSANYLKRLPVPPISDDQARAATAIVDEARTANALTAEQCNAFVDDLTRRGSVSVSDF